MGYYGGRSRADPRTLANPWLGAEPEQHHNILCTIIDCTNQSHRKSLSICLNRQWFVWARKARTTFAESSGGVARMESRRRVA